LKTTFKSNSSITGTTRRAANGAPPSAAKIRAANGTGRKAKPSPGKSTLEDRKQIQTKPRTVAHAAERVTPPALATPLAPRTIVLKFGGSVLKHERDVLRVVHEVYRWLREGYRVVAVVSAIEGQTDALLDCASAYGANASEDSTALLLATGELQSAALLGLALGRAGIDAAVLTPWALGLRTLGDTLDAEPVSLDVDRIERTLNRVGVCVVPGFVGVGHGGGVTLLGRGGSDLTALFLAQRLGARCRLIKDVDGLYQHDPAKPGPRPLRYALVSVNEALTLGGHIVQNKALALVHGTGLHFEVGSLGGVSATLVTPNDQGRTLELAPTLARALRVAVLGFGTVGQGVVALLRCQQAQFDVRAIAARDLDKARRAGALNTEDGTAPPLLTSDLTEAVRSADVVVECLGGLEPARSAIAKALRAGAHVVSANKAVLAAHGPALRALAARRGLSLRCGAAVGGAAPVLEHAALLAGAVVRVRAVLNATSNFVLDRVLAGDGFEDAVRAAQQAGFAEADPSTDLDGHDAANKLVLLAHAVFGIRIEPSSVTREPLTAQAIAAALAKASPGQRPRSIAWLEREPHGSRAARVDKQFTGQLRAGVSLINVGLADPLAGVEAERNCAVFELSDGTRRIVGGRGAGRLPTAQAVLGDLLELWRAGSPIALE